MANHDPNLGRANTKRPPFGRVRPHDVPARTICMASVCLCLLALAACGPATAGPSPAAAAAASLYLVSGDGTGDGNDALYALRASDGRLRWSAPLIGNEHGPPIAAGGTVYVGGEVGSAKSGPGGVTAVRAQDGKQLWQRTFGGLFASTPIPGPGAVFTSTWTGVYALRPSDGHILWRLQPSQPWSAPPRLTLVRGVLYVAAGALTPGTSATLYAMRPSDGSVLWRFQPPNSGEETDFNLVVTSAGVFLATAASLYVLRLADGALAWSAPTANGTAVVTEGTVYLVTGPGAYCTPAGTPVAQVTSVVARRPSDGAVRWSTHLDGMAAVAAGPSALATSNEIYAQVETGTISCQASSKRESPFTAVADTLIALAGNSGAVLWHHTVSGSLAFGALQAANQILYATAGPYQPGNGALYAFAAGSGAILWQRDLAPPASGSSWHRALST